MKRLVFSIFFTFLVACTVGFLLLFLSTEILTQDSFSNGGFKDADSSTAVYPVAKILVDGFLFPVAILFLILWVASLLFLPYWIWSIRQNIRETKKMAIEILEKMDEAPLMDSEDALPSKEQLERTFSFPAHEPKKINRKNHLDLFRMIRQRAATLERLAAQKKKEWRQAR